MRKEVRLATIEDFDFIYDMLCEDLKEQGIFHRFKYSKSDFKSTIFGVNPPAIFLILLIDDQLAGFTNYSIDNRNFTVNHSSNLYINDIFVKKSYRRMRGAALLIDKLKEIACHERCGRIEFFVLADNIDALAFYENFVRSKIISKDLYYMRLELEV